MTTTFRQSTPTLRPALPRAALASLALALSLAALGANAQTRTAAPQRAAPPPGCPEGWSPVPQNLNSALRCLPDNYTATLGPGIEAPPPGCPAGWQPVAPGVNPLLRCLPTNRAAPTRGAAGPQPGCPTGWKPAPHGLNPALRCVPANLVLTPRPGSAAPPAGCPSGWKPVAPGVNPVLGCLPGQVGLKPNPQAERDPGGPIQAQFVAPVDLVLIEDFRLGDQSIPWGTEATVSASSAAFRRLGRCGFRYLYRTRNDGQLASGATANRVMRDAQDGDVLATKALPALASGAVGTSDGHLSLAPGTWMLYVHADAPGNVAESDEANNLRRVRVNVEGNCG
jgi:hypothetical protein